MFKKKVIGYKRCLMALSAFLSLVLMYQLVTAPVSEQFRREIDRLLSLATTDKYTEILAQKAAEAISAGSVDDLAYVFDRAKKQGSFFFDGLLKKVIMLPRHEWDWNDPNPRFGFLHANLLGLAVASQNKELVRYLLDQGAWYRSVPEKPISPENSPELYFNQGFLQPLHHAALGGSVDIARMIIEWAQKTMPLKSDKFSRLGEPSDRQKIFGAQNLSGLINSTEAVYILNYYDPAARGLGANYETNNAGVIPIDGNANMLRVTPLQLALMRKNYPLVDYFLALGAIPQNHPGGTIMTTFGGNTIASNARNYQQVPAQIVPTVEKLLPEYEKAKKMRSRKTVNNFRLLTVARDDDVKKLLELLQEGANPNLQDDNGRTALHFAAENKRMESVQNLLDFGADPKIADKQGIMPHHLCPNKLEELRILVAYGAPLFAKDKKGDTVFDKAAEIGDILPIKWLINRGFKYRSADLEKALLTTKKNGFDTLTELIQNTLNELKKTT